MNIRCIVYIFDSVSDYNDDILDNTCTKLCSKFNNLFNIKISIGGNAENYGLVRKHILDEWFLTEYVINLAMMSYLEAITSQTFFHDEDLVRKHFCETFYPDNNYSILV